MQTRSASDWLKAKKKEGKSGRSKYFLERFEEVSAELARIQVAVFFLVNELGLTECMEILASCRRQRSFLMAMEINLKKYVVDEEWSPAIQATLTNLRGRLVYLHDIVIPETIRMTDIFPYFREVGFAKLDEYAENYCTTKKAWGNQGKIVSRLRDEITAWKKAHTRDIADYMESIAAERGKMLKHRKNA